MNSARRSTFFTGLLLAVSLLLAGCDQLDPYAAKFEQIQIGAPRAQILELLGTPATVNSIEVPMMKAEELVWRVPASSRAYVVHTAMGYVIGKSVMQ